MRRYEVVRPVVEAPAAKVEVLTAFETRAPLPRMVKSVVVPVPDAVDEPIMKSGFSTDEPELS